MQKRKNAKKYITIYDKKGNAVLIEESLKQAFVGRGFFDKDPKTNTQEKR